MKHRPRPLGLAQPWSNRHHIRSLRQRLQFVTRLNRDKHRLRTGTDQTNMLGACRNRHQPGTCTHSRARSQQYRTCVTMASAVDQYMAKMAFVRISRTWSQASRQNVVIQQLGNRTYFGVNLGRDIEIVKFEVPAELRALSGPLAEFEPYKRASTFRTNRYGYSYTRVTAQPRWQINCKYRLMCCIDLRDEKLNDQHAEHDSVYDVRVVSDMTGQFKHDSDIAGINKHTCAKLDMNINTDTAMDMTHECLVGTHAHVYNVTRRAFGFLSQRVRRRNHLGRRRGCIQHGSVSYPSESTV